MRLLSARVTGHADAEANCAGKDQVQERIRLADSLRPKSAVITGEERPTPAQPSGGREERPTPAQRAALWGTSLAPYTPGAASSLAPKSARDNP
ncbi:hypothetical protein T484DRAFT_1850899 [Baffinella frigidus]|nr:hypothetical protein T484DRAFT_1850899 [Cryptophyta sp. CCMP2293]